jgi:uncharacterized heparinase superfamily protein
MADTTNYDWPTPDDVDPVKDGALAIRNLGEAIDTAMTKALTIVEAKGTAGASLALALGDGAYQTVTIGEIVTVTTSGWPSSGTAAFLAVEISMGTKYAVTWPAAIKWHPDLTAPDLNANTRTLVVLATRDGGTTIEGFYSGARSTL